MIRDVCHKINRKILVWAPQKQWLSCSSYTKSNFSQCFSYNLKTQETTSLFPSLLSPSISFSFLFQLTIVIVSRKERTDQNCFNFYIELKWGAKIAWHKYTYLQH